MRKSSGSSHPLACAGALVALAAAVDHAMASPVEVKAFGTVVANNTTSGPFVSVLPGAPVEAVCNVDSVATGSDGNGRDDYWNLLGFTMCIDNIPLIIGTTTPFSGASVWNDYSQLSGGDGLGFYVQDATYTIECAIFGFPIMLSSPDILDAPYKLSYLDADPFFGTVFTVRDSDTFAELLVFDLECLITGECAADLAEPFGTLDFSDVVAFLTAFDSLDPAADLAAPFGQWDFSDVSAFLTAFGAGCP